MRLVSAEILKLRRRRGLMIWSLILTVGCVLVAEIVLVVLHAVNAAHHGPAGGAENFKGVILLLTGLGSVAAVIIGATAGTQDVAKASSATLSSPAASAPRSSTCAPPARCVSSCRCSRSGSRSRSP